ncbi:MAG: beta-lactamase family protein [Nitrospira sp.]|nr:beta-lactamase family protein [Nitrospira sp.]
MYLEDLPPLLKIQTDAKTPTMENLLNYLTAIALAIFLCSCNAKPSTETPVESPSLTYSESYKAPVFLNDVRKEEILKMAPEIQQLMEAHAENRHIPGIAYGIVVDNELILASATGSMNIEQEMPATPSSSFRIASMTKSFTAMAILKLRDEGKLTLADPVSKYIPEVANLEYLTRDAPAITIENLLTMTAGFPEDNPWGDRQLDEPDQMLMDLVREGVSFANVPAYAFEYSNTGYALLGHIISQVAGLPFQDYISQNILLPLGMAHTYWEYDSVPATQLALGYRWEDEQWKLEPLLHDGSFGAMGGLITSIEDFSKYVSYLLSAWPPRNEEDHGPVKRSSLREMQTSQFSRLYPNEEDFNGDPCAVMAGYGYGLGIAEYCSGLRRVSHGGALPGFGSNYVFFPEYGIGVMAFCNLTYTSPYPFREIGKLLFGNELIKPRQLPVSDILLERQAQVTQLIQHWEPDLEAELLAENFFLDKSREKRMSDTQDILQQAGPLGAIGDLEPENQLRGRYEIQAENGTIRIFFTLTPESSPKVQQLNLSFQPKSEQ